MSSRADRRAFTLAMILAIATACATSSGMRRGRQAELAQDFDRAVVEYTKLVRANPANTDVRLALQRVKLGAPQDHGCSGRRLACLERYDEAAVEYQLASELNPT